MDIELSNTVCAENTADELIHEVFERQAARLPDSPAVVYAQHLLTQGELNSKANKLARCLRGRGVRTDSLVGLCMERGLDLIVGILGILKAGGAYVPLDPHYPAERLNYILDDSAPELLLTQTHLRDRLPSVSAMIIELDGDWEEIDKQAADNLPSRSLGQLPSQLCYVIYTSGSTGRPKGVMVEHRNVVRLFRQTEQWFRFNERDVWTLFHSFAFDFSVWELWGGLFYGGKVVIVPFEVTRSPADFYRLLSQQAVTVLNQTPSAFAQLIEAQDSSASWQHSLRAVIFGGEALSPRSLHRWVKRNDLQRTQLINMYGITETTVHVTYHRITHDDIEQGTGSPIGKPIPDLQIHLLDTQGAPVAPGVTGEIHVGGAGVVRGYLNRPQLTAERFPSDRFTARPQARLYRSGDLGRWRADGSLEYLGRNDRQVKIRGFRIELGEIESALKGYAEVRDAVVLVQEELLKDKRLVAYVVGAEQTYEPASVVFEQLSTEMLVLPSIAELPDSNHLLSVIERAGQQLGGRGTIWIRDVLRTGLLTTMHSWKQLSKAPRAISNAELRKRIARAVASESEFAVEPRLFYSIAERISGITAVEIRYPQSTDPYRYDALLRFGAPLSTSEFPAVIDWCARLGSYEKFLHLLQTPTRTAMCLLSIPDIRWAGQAAALDLVNSSESVCEVSELCRRLESAHWAGFDSERLMQVASSQGYRAWIRPTVAAAAHHFDLLLVPDECSAAPIGLWVPPSGAYPQQSLTNSPSESRLRRALIHKLKSGLRDRLPSYMIPSAWVLLKEMPLTEHGKVDRRSLPDPRNRPDEAGEYAPPSTSLEHELGAIWAEVLQVDQVGIRDHFIDLGGDSIRSMKIIARVARELHVEVPMSRALDCFTVEAMAQCIESLELTQTVPSATSGYESGVL